MRHGPGRNAWTTTVFLQNLVSLQATRARLKRQLLDTTNPNLQTAYTGHRNPEVSFTLGKAGPLKEETSLTFAKEVEQWAEKLAVTEKRLVYPERRTLKEKTPPSRPRDHRRTAPKAATGGTPYRPPDERSPGEETVSARRGREGKSAAAESGSRGGFGGSGARGSRAGLLFSQHHPRRLYLVRRLERHGRIANLINPNVRTGRDAFGLV